VANSVEPIKVVGGSTFGRYSKISGRRVYNMFSSDGWQVDFPGWKKVLDFIESVTGERVEGRALFRSIRGKFAVAVAGNQVWAFDRHTGATFVGSLDTSKGDVFMDENLNAQICIVDRQNAYILHYSGFAYTLTLQESGVQIPTELTPNYVRFHDTYFLVGNGDTTGNGSKWYAFSRATDTTIEETYELALQTKPDYAIAIERLSEKGNNVLVFGTAVTEVQTNVGGLQGYRRVSTMNIDYGVLSVATIASSDNMVAWLGINEKSPPVIMYFDGAQHKTISTDGINYLLGSLTAPHKSFAFFFKRDGHLFYQITFYDDEDNLTLAYDFNNGLFINLSDKDLNYHPARQVIYLGDKSYFISFNNGAIYETSTNITTYDENIVTIDNPAYDVDLVHMIPRQIVCDTIRLSNQPKAYSMVDLYVPLEQGQESLYSQAYFESASQDYMITQEGDYMITEDGDLMITETANPVSVYQPRVDLSFSMDGAVTWSNEVGRVMNFSGYRKNMMQWNNLGWMNECTPKLKFWTYGRVVVGDGQATLQI
jgi:hypothetical protein